MSPAVAAMLGTSTTSTTTTSTTPLPSNALVDDLDQALSLLESTTNSVDRPSTPPADGADGEIDDGDGDDVGAQLAQFDIVVRRDGVTAYDRQQVCFSLMFERRLSR